MPCSDSNYDPSYDERESRKVCKLLYYLLPLIGKDTPKWVIKGKDSYYGDASHLIDAETLLYKTIISLSFNDLSKFVYNPYKKEARRLADWYEEYREKTEATNKKLLLKKQKEDRAKSLLAKMREEEVKIIEEYFKGGKY